jgi:hypothetical protein
MGTGPLGTKPLSVLVLSTLPGPPRRPTAKQPPPPSVDLPWPRHRLLKHILPYPAAEPSWPVSGYRSRPTREPTVGQIRRGRAAVNHAPPGCQSPEVEGGAMVA